MKALSRFSCFTLLVYRSFFFPGSFLIRIPTQWNAQKGPTPILFIHGLGLGLLQYYTVFIELFGSFTDRPILIPLQPHISQDIFHPRYLTPLPRREAVKRYTSLITKLGWTSDIALGMGEDDSSFSVSGRGVTVVSHSKSVYTSSLIRLSILTQIIL